MRAALGVATAATLADRVAFGAEVLATVVRKATVEAAIFKRFRFVEVKGLWMG